jgi:hypothetical protein
MACATKMPALKSPINTAASSIMARIQYAWPALTTSSIDRRWIVSG